MNVDKIAEPASGTPQVSARGGDLGPPGVPAASTFLPSDLIHATLDWFGPDGERWCGTGPGGDLGGLLNGEDSGCVYIALAKTYSRVTLLPHPAPFTTERETVQEAMAAIHNVIAPEKPYRGRDVFRWNDDDATLFSDVQHVLKIAAYDLEAEGR